MRQNLIEHFELHQQVDVAEKDILGVTVPLRKIRHKPDKTLR